MRSSVETEFELFLADLWGLADATIMDRATLTPRRRRTGRESELDYGSGYGQRRPYVPSAATAMVHAAIRRGVTDENGLTDLVFFQRYPARNGRPISRNEPNFGQLSQEWLSIRDTLVRPILAELDPTRLRCTRFAGDRDLAAVLAARLRLGPAGTSAVPTPVRSSGSAVRQVQTVLISAGYPLPRSGADGRFGPETAAAVSRFKADRRIEPPGPVVGPATIRALNVSCLLLESDQGRMIDVSRATRYIAVASPSPTVIKEWGRRRVLLPVHKDYALMKVLYTLRSRSIGETIGIHAFQYDKPVPTPLDFSGLRDSDVIFIAGHGDQNGLYAMGPKASEGTDRLVELLTGDGNLKKLRRNKNITIMLLSCRAGLGLYKSLAKRLSNALSINTTVGGAVGFTFGSNRTSFTARNEVLVPGIPWIMEYPGSLPVPEAERQTSAREGKTITVAAKRPEINQFCKDKEALEKGMKGVVQELRSTEVNTALNEIDTRFRSRWRSLLQAQFELYARAKTASNLEFDMWFDNIADGYLWTDATATTDREVDALLAGDLRPVDATSLTCTR
jgi:Putative peptidoglycan binding domain